MSQVELPRGVEVLMPSPVAMACCPTLATTKAKVPELGRKAKQ
jgi:hypothetical protein